MRRDPRLNSNPLLQEAKENLKEHWLITLDPLVGFHLCRIKKERMELGGKRRRDSKIWDWVLGRVDFQASIAFSLGL